MRILVKLLFSDRTKRSMKKERWWAYYAGSPGIKDDALVV